jgi:hypothetical protein
VAFAEGLFTQIKRLIDGRSSVGQRNHAISVAASQILPA